MHELLDYYLRGVLPAKAPGTQAQYAQVLGVVRQQFGTLPLPDLTPARLRQWRDTLRTSLAPATVRLYLDTLSAPLTIAVNELEWLPANPVQKVRKPPLTPGRTRCLSPEEQARLLAACRASRNRALYPIVMIALMTGARKGEILGLRWVEVDLVQSLLRLMRTKNKHPRVVPLLRPARAALHAWATTQESGQALVFPSPKGRPQREITQAWKHACRPPGSRISGFMTCATPPRPT